ncbi:MAG: rhodanese-related sulfurtransferase [Leptolyngbyaceae cyanobacterium SM2_5_2]|nr:rhodanese-related sulfurtransferase [Leptolyngbyaceae cyanobacterium SM2_5_2]
MVWTIATFYKFVPLADLDRLQLDVLAHCQQWELCGTILLAPEGINATVAGDRQSIDQLLAWLSGHAAIGSFEHQDFTTTRAPFERLKVKLKDEIVALGRPDVDPTHQVGTYVDPQDWNQLITDPDLLLIDTRNAFEVEMGTFEGAISPNTRAFCDLPAYVKVNLDPERHKKIAMFCTGGIRCEKATAYMLNQGFEQVYHLKGGILNYLNKIPPTNSLWRGECFVFDDRVAVDHTLQPIPYVLCGGCGHPVSPAEQSSPPLCARGITCPPLPI